MWSWMAMAAAADSRYTLELVINLPYGGADAACLGRGDDVQKISFARRYVTESSPSSDLIEEAGKHLRMEDSRREIAAAMLEHLLAFFFPFSEEIGSEGTCKGGEDGHRVDGQEDLDDA